MGLASKHSKRKPEVLEAFDASHENSLCLPVAGIHVSARGLRPDGWKGLLRPELAALPQPASKCHDGKREQPARAGGALIAQRGARQERQRQSTAGEGGPASRLPEGRGGRCREEGARGLGRARHGRVARTACPAGDQRRSQSRHRQAPRRLRAQPRGRTEPGVPATARLTSVDAQRLDLRGGVSDHVKAPLPGLAASGVPACAAHARVPRVRLPTGTSRHRTRCSIPACGFSSPHLRPSLSATRSMAAVPHPQSPSRDRCAIPHGLESTDERGSRCSCC
jgi:hypothetical protein